MILGPHLEKEINLNDQRAIAKIEGWGAIQTNWGNVQSFGIANDFLTQKFNGNKHDVFWSIHCPYVLTIAPKEENREGAATFLKQIIRLAKKWEIDCLVVHTGSVVGVPVKDYLKRMTSFVDDNGILVELERANTRLAIEFGASVCGINLHPGFLAQELESRYAGMIGYCVDVAHFPAAGCSYETIMNLIEKIPPIITHINYCGSIEGSSQDLHGWRSHPEIGKRKKEFFIRDSETIKKQTNNYDNLIKLLVGKNIPMILEGSSFPEGNLWMEMKTVKGILS